MPHKNKQKQNKKWKTFGKNGFQRENRLKISDEKKRKTFSLHQTTPWNTRLLETIIEYGLCKQWEIN